MESTDLCHTVYPSLAQNSRQLFEPGQLAGSDKKRALHLCFEIAACGRRVAARALLIGRDVEHAPRRSGSLEVREAPPPCLYQQYVALRMAKRVMQTATAC